MFKACGLESTGIAALARCVYTIDSSIKDLVNSWKLTLLIILHPNFREKCWLTTRSVATESAASYGSVNRNILFDSSSQHQS